MRSLFKLGRALRTAVSFFDGAGMVGGAYRAVACAAGGGRTYGLMLRPAQAGRLVVASLCVLAGAVVFASSPALSFETHVFSSSFGGPGSGAGELSSPAGVAINSVTHDVYVADTGNFRVDEFSSSGAFIRAWGWGVADGLPVFESCALVCQKGLPGSGEGQFTTPVFVAVDNSGGASEGDMYVGDTGDNLVSKFDASGNLVSGWGSGGQLNGSTTSAGSFGRLAGVAVDSSGKLTVINENESKLVFEFAQDGTFATQFEVARGTAPNGLAVDAMGNIFKVNGSEDVEEVTGSGSDVGQVTLSKAAKGIAVDPLTGDLYTDEGGHVEQYVFSGAGIVSEPGGSTCVVKPEAGCGASDSFGSGNLTGGTGIAVDPVSGTSGTVYVADAATSGIDVFVPTVIPDVNTGQASNVHPAGVTLNGSVDPDGLQVTACRFEYGTSGYYGQSIPCEQAPGSGTSPVAVSANLTALQPNTEYHFRLLASNANGIKYGVDVTVTTTGPPRFDGEWATNVTTTSATFNTKVNPLWPTNAEYRLEYGTSTSYGQTLTGSVGEGANDLLVSVHRQDLQPGTTYHYRFVDSNVYGTVEGPDHVFTTQATGGQEASLLDGRAWELVSPAKKNGALIEGHGGGGVPVQAASDGSGISYGASEAIGENPEGKTVISQILSDRGPDGWKSQDISLPQSLLKEEELAYDGYEYQMFSPDLSLAAIWQQAVAANPLAPEAADGKLYLRDDTDGSFLPLFTTANIPLGTNLHEEIGEGKEAKVEFATATPDLSHVILASRLVFTSEAIEGSRESPDKTIPQQMNLYEWSAGRFQPVNVLPGEITTEKTVPGANIGGSTQYGNIPRAVSSDGRWVVWTLGAPYFGEPSSLYVRDMVEKRTVQIGGNDARVLAMSSDGSKIFFLEGSGEGGYSHTFQGGELYEFDTATGVQTDLTSDHGPGESSAGVKEGLLGTSEDGSWVYFMANGVLGDGAERGATTGNCMTLSHGNSSEGSCNLYVWHDGTTMYIARLSSEDQFDWYYEAFGGAQSPAHVRSRVSPDGRYLTFMSSGSLTGYDNLDANSGEPDEEVYMYDAVTDRLVCASCDPTGARPVGISGSSNILMEDTGGPGSLQGHWLAGVTPTSQDNLDSHAFHQPRYLSDTGRLFFDSPDALVPQDTNGLMDAYEYEPAGVGSCTAVSITFSERSGGCVSLVSSGTSSQESAFYDASENGDDAFFLTASRLSAADYDTSIDVYDAHVCSTAVPCAAVPVLPPPCTSGDSCKAAPSPQPDIFGPTPSATFNGAGNVVASPLGSVVKPKSLTRAQKLARALKACRREGARRRAVCERQVRKRYAVKRSPKANAKKKGGRR